MSTFAAGNPALRPDVFGSGTMAEQATRSSTMTVSGAIHCSLILTLTCAASAVAGYGLVQNNPGLLQPLAIGSGIVGLITCIALCFNPLLARWLSLPYAVVQGLFIGGISMVYAHYFRGTKVGGATGDLIILNAGLLTLGTLFSMLVLYRSGIIRATEKFKAVMCCAIGGVVLFSLTVWIVSLFGVRMPWLWDGGPISILISAAILLVAAFKLVLDFDLIESGARAGAPKALEWYAGFGLLVTLIWLYLEFLRLLALLNRRD